MEFTINVKVDCTDRIAAFLQYVILSATPATTQKDSVSVNTDNASVNTEKVVEVVEIPSVKEAEHKEESPAKVATPVEITDEDLRAAIRDCKTRLLGEDVNADRSKKNLVIAKLKAFMKSVGVETSRDIPQEKRAEFIEYCGYMVIDEEDNEQPF